MTAAHEVRGDVYAPCTVPRDLLVAPAHQPHYLSGERVLGDDANVGRALSDAAVSAGLGAQVAAIHAESGRSLTYAQLALRSSDLARGLIESAVKPGDRVAFRGPNTPETLLVAAAAWKAGAVVVPTPAQARAEELAFLLEDSGASVLLAHPENGDLSVVDDAAARSGVRSVIAYSAGPTPASHRSWTELAASAIDPDALPSDTADMPAVLWHTGGTTGKPKACYHTHRRYILGGLATGAALGLSPGDRFGAAAPIGHALGFLVYTSFSVLNGATAVSIERFRDPEVVVRAIADTRIDTFAAIAATWARLLEAAEADPALDLTSLRRCYALWQSASTGDLADRWARRGVRLRNNFGSTAFASWVIVSREEDECPPASLGRPSPGYRVGIVDPASRVVEVPTGPALGQMAVQGPTGLTYWGRGELQQREVVDGWTLVDDLIEFDEHGFVFYRGRTDFLISTAGYKVAPVEIEEVLATHPAVREVGVVGAPDPDRGEVVAAFVAVVPGTEADDALRRELQDYVKERLAPYKYPRRLEFIDALPRDHVGKILPRVLKSWATDGTAGDE